MSAVLVNPFAMCCSLVNRFIWVARLTRSEDHLSRRASERANRQCSCGFGRTVPQFTFILLKRFVNSISAVSTGFLPVLPVFIGEGRKNRLFSWISSFVDTAASSTPESKRFPKKVRTTGKITTFVSFSQLRAGTAWVGCGRLSYATEAIPRCTKRAPRQPHGFIVTLQDLKGKFGYGSAAG
jgi:hypothetical protein